MTVIEINGLSKCYGNGAVRVFEDVSFSVDAGESVALIGSNGAGKSTLLRCCLRLIEPDQGEISIQGQTLMNVDSTALRKVRSHIGFVFQQHNLVPSLSVLTNVLHGVQNRERGLGSWYQAFARNTDRAYAMYCLERVGLADLASRRARDLSGGQSQRVAIARALMQKAEIMIADEPVASLDPRAGEEVMELFLQLIKAENLTLLFVSHNLEHSLKYSDRILGLQDQKLVINEYSSEHSVDSLREIFK